MNKYLEVLKVGRELLKSNEKELFSLFFSRVDFEFNEKVPLAGIGYRNNHFTIIFSDLFFKLPEQWKVGVLAHELIHYMYMHPLIYHDRCGDIVLQISMDLFINQIIEKLFPSSLPDGSIPEFGKGIYIDNFIKDKYLKESDRNKDTMYYYNRLQKYKDKLEDKWNMSHTWEMIGDLSELEKEVQKLRVENIVKQCGNVSELFRDIKVAKKKSKIDYKKIISGFLSNSFLTNQNFSYSYMNKRFPGFPGSYEVEVPSLLFAIDTSGSIGEEDINQVFDQIDTVYKLGCEIDILEVDCSINKEKYKYTGKRPSKMSGGGGTDFEPAIRYYNENCNKYGAMIYLTDGYANVPSIKPIRELLWILISNTLKTPESMKQEGFKGLFLKLEYE